MSVPGCFAAASVFASESVVCQQCESFNACSDESLKTLEAIKGLVNVTDLLKRHAANREMLGRLPVRAEELICPTIAGAAPAMPITTLVERKTKLEKVLFEISPEDEVRLQSLGVKPQDQARRLCSNGLMSKIKTEVQAGRNALATSSPRFIAVAIDTLISGGFTKSSLKSILQSELGWGESTASSHVSQVCPMFTVFGIAQEKDGMFVVAPAISA